MLRESLQIDENRCFALTLETGSKDESADSKKIFIKIISSNLKVVRKREGWKTAITYTDVDNDNSKAQSKDKLKVKVKLNLNMAQQ